MIEPSPDIATTLFTLPPDAKFLPLSELSPRLRARIGVVEEGQSVITRPGFRVTTRLVPAPLAGLIAEFREPSLLTDAVSRFARRHDEDPFTLLDLAFDALATLVEARILVPEGSPDATAPAPSLAMGQEFAGFEIETLVRSLEDSEVYRARGRKGAVALKIARDDRPAVRAMLAGEARMLERLGGIDTPRFYQCELEGERPWVAMEWCDGVSIAVAAQQARASRERRRLHELVARMIDAYGRLHQQGVLHGDVHPGNCLARDDGRVVLLDFGNARPVDSAAVVDPMRSGIPQFYDPQMAGALLAGALPPAVTAASEQYAIAVLAYLLLTGLQPIDSPSVHDELLMRIVERPPLPFAARGVPAWPEAEAVVGRGLAREPADRYPDVTSMGRAFRSAGRRRRVAQRWPDAARRAFDTAVERVRSLESFRDPVAHAWFGLRAALALEDAELLAAADVLAGRGGSDCVARSVAALVARAQSDRRAEGMAIAGFLTAAESLRDEAEIAAALVTAAAILDGTTFLSPDMAALAEWSIRRLEQSAHSIDEPLWTHAALSLVRTGAIPRPADLLARVEAVGQTRAGDLWFWSEAYDVFAEERFKARAVAARPAGDPLSRGLGLLRLHQLTGDLRWVAAARRVVAKAPGALVPAFDTALLMAELMNPERAIPPPGAHCSATACGLSS